MNGLDFVISISNNSTTVIDLPLELIVSSGTYDGVNKQIVLTLANGSTIDIPIGDLISDIYNQSEVDTLLLNKVDKETGKSLVSDTDIAKLANLKLSDLGEKNIRPINFFKCWLLYCFPKTK